MAKTKSRSKRTKSSKGLWIFAGIFALVGIVALASIFALGPQKYRLDAQSMFVTTNNNTNLATADGSNAKLVLAMADGAEAKGLLAPDAASSTGFRVELNNCAIKTADYPAITAKINGKKYMSATSVNTSQWSTYIVSVPLAVGTHFVAFGVSFPNPAPTTMGGTCTPKLRLDQIYTVAASGQRHRQVAIAVKDPTISASDHTLLGWYSYGMSPDSCVASGAWSGPKASTGAIDLIGVTQTSTYTLSCTSESQSHNPFSNSATLTIK